VIGFARHAACRRVRGGEAARRVRSQTETRGRVEITDVPSEAFRSREEPAGCAPRVADQYRGPGIRLAARTDPRDAVMKGHDLAERDARLPVEQRDLSSRPGRRRL